MIFKIELAAEVKDAKARRLLKRIQSNTEHMQPAWHQVGNFAKSEVIKNVEAGGRPKKFTPLSAIYAKWKAAHGYTDQVLIKSQKLKGSFHFRDTKLNVRVYTSLKYAVAHQEGKGNLPERKFMPDSKDRNIPPFDDQSMYRIKEILSKFILR